ncbi:hypothetical protein [Propionicimonas sp.]|uniref:hypothetical protein n=1 Tax=Propionicimonas sp. TaxID=1955623 RepID=UPI0039E37322
MLKVIVPTELVAAAVVVGVVLAVADAVALALVVAVSVAVEDVPEDPPDPDDPPDPPDAADAELLAVAAGVAAAGGGQASFWPRVVAARHRPAAELTPVADIPVNATIAISAMMTAYSRWVTPRSFPARSSIAAFLPCRPSPYVGGECASQHTHLPPTKEHKGTSGEKSHFRAN